MEKRYAFQANAKKKIRTRAIIKNNNELKNETKTKLIADQN